jgi:hypothetical protein
MTRIVLCGTEINMTPADSAFNIKGYELLRPTQARWTETLNLLQFRMAVLPLDLVTGRSRDFPFYYFIFQLLTLLRQALW